MGPTQVDGTVGETGGVTPKILVTTVAGVVESGVKKTAGDSREKPGIVKESGNGGEGKREGEQRC